MEFQVLPLVLPTEDRDEVDYDAIKNLCNKSLDHCPPDDRAVAWLVLSGVMPRKIEEWPEQKASMVSSYRDWVELFGMKSYEDLILPNTTEKYDFQLKDQSKMQLIHGDVVRTAHHIEFFPYPCPTEGGTEVLDCFQPHMRRLERILYLFAETNVGLGYIQGFHELLCPIFSTFLTALEFCCDDWDEVEVYSFFVFQNLINRTSLNELHTMTDRASLIYKCVGTFTSLLEKRLPKIYEVIKYHDIHSLDYVLSRLSLMFAQEYDMPVLVTIWDTIFAHFDDLVVYLSYLAVAHVYLVRDLIDIEDKNATMIALRKIPVDNVLALVSYASNAYEEDKRPPVSKMKKLLSIINPHSE